MPEPILISREVVLALKRGDKITDASGFVWEVMRDAEPYEVPDNIGLGMEYFAKVMLKAEHWQLYLVGKATDDSIRSNGTILFDDDEQGGIQLELSSSETTVTKAA